MMVPNLISNSFKSRLSALPRESQLFNRISLESCSKSTLFADFQKLTARGPERKLRSLLGIRWYHFYLSRLSYFAPALEAKLMLRIQYLNSYLDRVQNKFTHHDLFKKGALVVKCLRSITDDLHQNRHFGSPQFQKNLTLLTQSKVDFYEFCDKTHFSLEDQTCIQQFKKTIKSLESPFHLNIPLKESLELLNSIEESSCFLIFLKNEKDSTKTNWSEREIQKLKIASADSICAFYELLLTKNFAMFGDAVSCEEISALSRHCDSIVTHLHKHYAKADGTLDYDYIQAIQLAFCPKNYGSSQYACTVLLSMIDYSQNQKSRGNSDNHSPSFSSQISPFEIEFPGQ